MALITSECVPAGALSRDEVEDIVSVLHVKMTDEEINEAFQNMLDREQAAADKPVIAAFDEVAGRVESETDEATGLALLTKVHIGAVLESLGEPVELEELDKIVTEMESQDGLVGCSALADWRWRQRFAEWGDDEEELVHEMFTRYDVDEGGTLDKEEAAVAVEELDSGINLTGFFAANRLDEIFEQMRPNEDDEIPFLNFRRWWKEWRQDQADREVDFASFEKWFWEHRETLEQEKQVQLRETFDRLDTDGSGALDKQEVAKLAAELGEKLASVFGSKKLDEAFAEMDPDNDGEVSFEEFTGWWKEKHDPPLVSQPAFDQVYHDLVDERAAKEKRKIREMFDRLDTDGSGALDKKEVGKLAAELGEKLTSVFGSKKLDEAFAEMDPENDGEVSFEKFTGWWTKQNQGSERKKELARDLVFKRDAFWARR